MEVNAWAVRVQGLWVVQAPGEAEATCAALNRGGFVDACATNDSDVLLFGAETAFHTLKPLVSPLPRDIGWVALTLASTGKLCGSMPSEHPTRASQHIQSLASSSAGAELIRLNMTPI